MSTQTYVTQRRHLDFPAGTRCMAERVQGTIFLEFEGGVVVALPGDRYYLEGIEVPPVNEMDREVLSTFFALAE